MSVNAPHSKEPTWDQAWLLEQREFELDAFKKCKECFLAVQRRIQTKGEAEHPPYLSKLLVLWEKQSKLHFERARELESWQMRAQIDP